MLDINPEIVCGIIVRAHEFHGKEGVVFPDDPGDESDDWAMRVLEEHAGDQTLEELRTTINDLEPDQQVSLVALMWLGRGDYTADDWETALEDAKDHWTPRTADYLLGTPLLADFLEEGLSQLGYSCEE